MHRCYSRCCSGDLSGDSSARHRIASTTSKRRTQNNCWGGRPKRSSLFNSPPNRTSPTALKQPSNSTMSTTTTNTAATAASDSNQTVALLPTEVRCSYPSKLCNNHRAVKDNGDLHKLCDFHRKKANVNQQRMQQKRRLIRQQMMERKKRFMDAAQAPMEYNAATDTMEPKEPICNLSHEEVMMLEAMLFDDEDGEGYASPGEDSAYATGYAMNTSGMPSNMSL